MNIKVRWLPLKLDGLALRWVILYKVESILPHEYIHIRQQKNIGFLRYCWKYIFDETFRYQMEYDAYRYGSKLSVDESIRKAKLYIVGQLRK